MEEVVQEVVAVLEDIEILMDQKLLVVEAYSAPSPSEAALEPTGRVLVVIDSLGAGIGEFVLITQGSSARMTERTKTMPVDAVVIGIEKYRQKGIPDEGSVHVPLLAKLPGHIDGLVQ